MNRKGICTLQHSLLLLSLTFLIGCTTSVNSPAPKASDKPSPTPVTVSSQKSKQPASTASKAQSLEKPGDTLENEAGKGTLVKINRPNATVKTGPMKLTIKTVALTTWEPTPQMSQLVGKEGIFTLASVAVEVENTSEDTIGFYPSQAILVAGREESHGNLLLTEEVGGDFIGREIKKGKVIFVLDTAAEDIETLKLVINAPHNQRFQQVGDQLTLEYALSQ